MKRPIVGLAMPVVTMALVACGSGGSTANHRSASGTTTKPVSCFTPADRFQLNGWIQTHNIVGFKTAPAGSSFAKADRPLCTPTKIGVTWYRVSRGSKASAVAVASNNFLVDGRSELPIQPKNGLAPGEYKLAIYHEWAPTKIRVALTSYNEDVELGARVGGRSIWVAGGVVR